MRFLSINLFKSRGFFNSQSFHLPQGLHLPQSFHVPPSVRALALSLPLLISSPWGWAGSNLVTQQIAGFDSAEISQNVDFKHYSTLWVEPAKVEFDRQWERQHSHDLSTQEKQKIATFYGEILQKSLNKALTESQQLSSAVNIDRHTLIIRPRLQELVINAPDMDYVGMKDTYVQYVGRATVALELVDGDSGAILATFQDKGKTREHPGEVLFKTDRVRNGWDFRQLTKAWGESLSTYLTPKK